MADPLINPETTLRYRDSLLRTMYLSEDEASRFHRIFLAPGVSHCPGGIGPYLADAMNTLADWTESEIISETLAVSIATTSDINVMHNLCAYPQHLSCNGSPDVNLASRFSCL